MEAGVGHRGIGLKGSDFITLFMPALTLASDPPTPQLADIGPDLVRPVLEVACAALLPGCRPLTTQVFPALHGFAAGQRAQVRPNRAVRGLQRARTVLEASENRRVTLHDLAHAAGKSTYYLSRTFAAAWGMPPSQYAKQRRLWDATCLLLDGRTVTESALRAGFSDTAHLSRTFRAQYGVSPSAWQAGVRSNRAGPSSP
jgi:AraC-like DNA-binding protein